MATASLADIQQSFEDLSDVIVEKIGDRLPKTGGEIDGNVHITGDLVVDGDISGLEG